MAHPHHAAFESFSVSAALILLAFIYALGWVRIRRLGQTTIEGWRAASFLIALFFIWVAVASPIAALEHELLTVHMVQHLLLMTFAAPLIWLGAPVMPFLHGLALRPLLRWKAITYLGRALVRPAFSGFAATAVLLGWHIPAAFRLALHSPAWHVFEHASFLTAGLLFWWPVVRPWPSAPLGARWSILLYLFLSTLPCDLLAAFLVFSERIAYPVYLSTSGHSGLSVLADQELAGALMWTCVTLVYLVPAAIISMKLLAPRNTQEDEQMQKSIEVA